MIRRLRALNNKKLFIHLTAKLILHFYYKAGSHRMGQDNGQWTEFALPLGFSLSEHNCIGYCEF